MRGRGLFPPPTVGAAVQRASPGPLYYDHRGPDLVRVCLAHKRPVPLRPDVENPMRCGLGHPVDDDAGWAVMDSRTGRIVERPVKVPSKSALRRLRLRGEGGESP